MQIRRLRESAPLRHSIAATPKPPYVPMATAPLLSEGLEQPERSTDVRPRGRHTQITEEPGRAAARTAPA